MKFLCTWIAFKQESIEDVAGDEVLDLEQHNKLHLLSGGTKVVQHSPPPKTSGGLKGLLIILFLSSRKKWSQLGLYLLVPSKWNPSGWSWRDHCWRPPWRCLAWLRTTSLVIQFWSGFIPVNESGRIYPTLPAISPTLHLARFFASSFFKPTLLLSFSTCDL